MTLWGALSALTVCGLAGWCWLLRGGNLLERLDVLQVGWLGLSAGCVALWLLLATTPPGAIRLSPRLSKRGLLVACVLIAAAAVFWLRPVLSPEVLRYRFDGAAWLLGQSPYKVSPQDAAARAAEIEDVELRPDELDLASPNAQRTTLNLPVSQAAFVATRTLEYLSPAPATQAPATRAQAPAGTDWRSWLLSLPWWRQLLFWRCLLAAAYLTAVAELIAWLRYRELSPWWSVVFAWQPLVVMEMLGAGHQDMIGVLLLIAGLRRADAGNMRRAALCLAASVAVKPLALLVLPFVLRRAWRADGNEEYPARRTEAPPAGALAARRFVGWFAATLALLLVPLYSGEALQGLWQAMQSYASASGQDAALPRLLEAMFAGVDASAERLVRVRLAAWTVGALAVLLVGLMSWQRRVSPAGAFYAMMLTGLLLGPVATPWLLVWPLAMVPILRGRAGPAVLVWAGTAAIYYGPQTLGGAGAPTNALLWQFAPVYAMALLEGVSGLAGSSSGRGSELALASGRRRTMPG